LCGLNPFSMRTWTSRARPGHRSRPAATQVTSDAFEVHREQPDEPLQVFGTHSEKPLRESRSDGPTHEQCMAMATMVVLTGLAPIVCDVKLSQLDAEMGQPRAAIGFSPARSPAG